MSAGRWRVYRVAGEAQPWGAQRRGAFSTWKQFSTWSEAYTYADKQARQ